MFEKLRILTSINPAIVRLDGIGIALEALQAIEMRDGCAATQAATST